MKNKIFLTILITILMASSAFAAAWPAFHAYPGPWAAGPTLVADTYTVSVESTAQVLTLLDNVGPALSTTALGAATYTGTNIVVADGMIMSTGAFWNDPSNTPDYTYIIYDVTKNAVITVNAFWSTNSVDYIVHDLDTNTKTGLTGIKRTDGFLWTVRAATYAPTTGYIYLGGLTTSGDVLFASYNTATDTNVAKNVLSDSGSNINVYGLAIVNGYTTFNGYQGAKPMTGTLAAATLLITDAYTITANTDEPTGSKQFAVDSVANTMITFNTVSNVLLGGSFIIGAGTGLITATAFSMPNAAGNTWTTIDNTKIISGGGSTMVVGSINDAPGPAKGAFAKFDNTNFNDDGAGHITTSNSKMTTIIGGGGNGIFAGGNIGNQNGFFLKMTNAGTLVSSGTQTSATFADIIEVTMMYIDMVVLGGKTNNEPFLVFINRDTAQQLITLKQDLTAGITNLATNPDKNAVYAGLAGSYGNQAFAQGGGNYPNPAPEFSLTTLLLATLLAGGLVLFVVRRRYK